MLRPIQNTIITTLYIYSTYISRQHKLRRHHHGTVSLPLNCRRLRNSNCFFSLFVDRVLLSGVRIHDNLTTYTPHCATPLRGDGSGVWNSLMCIPRPKAGRCSQRSCRIGRFKSGPVYSHPVTQPKASALVHWLRSEGRVACASST